MIHDEMGLIVLAFIRLKKSDLDPENQLNEIQNLGWLIMIQSLPSWHY